MSISVLPRAASLRGLLLISTLASSAAVAPAQFVTSAGDRLSPEAFGPARVVDLRELTRLESAARRRPLARIERTRNEERGAWRIPSARAAGLAHSGRLDLTNTWGDTLMGIGFTRLVHLEGVWVRAQSSRAVWAGGLRAHGYRDGTRVASTEWVRGLDLEPQWFEIDLADINRVVFEAEASGNGGGWYALDDLSYFTGEARERRLLDFEDLSYGQVLSGSGYAGLEWERGSGSVQAALTVVDQYLSPNPSTKDGVPSSATASSSGATGGALAGSATSPTLVSNFEGTRLFDTGAAFIPPDCNGVAGLDHFVEVVNANYSVFEKSDGLRVVDVSMNTLFGTGGNPGDPRVVLDPDSNRWFVITTNFLDRIYLAVSTTTDPTGPYFTTHFLTNEGADAGKVPEYPTLGVDTNGLYIGCNMFSGSATGTLFALEKAPLIDVVPALGAVTAFRELPFEGALQACVTHGAAPGEYVISHNDASSLRLRRVDPPLTAPTLVDLGTVTIPGHAPPPGAPVLGSSTPLDPVDDRPMNAVWEAGSLWTIHGIEVDTRAALRWYEIDTSALATTQVGTIADPVLSFVMGSIAVNNNGDCVMGFSGSSASQYAGAYFTGRQALDPAGLTAAPVEYQAGQASYELIDAFGRNRWGDYSGASVDPADPSVFWTVQEVAGSIQDHWSTNIAQLQLPAFPDCNGNGIDDAIDIFTGTSSDCDSNGVPDECQPDCDDDGLPDVCETDCNANGTPDDCESFADCNSNGIPDECETDCNENGVPDDCDIASGTSLDLNGNSIPDECECRATSYCSTAPNSVGGGALMDSSGSYSVSLNDTSLIATDLPPNQFGLFFYGPNQIQISFGNGFRCIGGGVKRFRIQQANILGVATRAIDLTDLPDNGEILSGETWQFQFWYRDPMGGGSQFNLSDGLFIEFCD